MPRSNKDEYIDVFLEAGYALMPVKSRAKGGRGALPVGWPSTKNDILLSGKDFPQNYGIVLQEDDLVLDVDPRNFDPGQNPFKQMVKDLGIEKEVTNTFRVRTGSGGYHIYFKKPPDLLTKEITEYGRALEFKAKGRYVIGPGSIHPVREIEYTIMNGSPLEVLPAPQAILDLIARSDGFDTMSGLGHYEEDEYTQNLFITYLKNTPAAIQGHMGDLTTYKVACVGKDYGLPPELTHELMLEHWNERCQPPWTPEEMRVKVRSAYQTGKQAKGAHHPDAAFDEVITALNKEYKRDPKNAHLDLKYDPKLHKKTGAIIPCFQTTVAFFKASDSPLFGLLQYNEFSNKIEFTRPAPWHTVTRPLMEWQDDDAIMLKHWLSVYRNYQVSVSECHDAAIYVAKRVGGYWNPVKHYFEKVKWDGVPRLDKILIDYAGAEDTPYVRAVSKNTFIAAVARTYQPGCQFDHILVLEGRQGTGKSSFCRVMGGPFYTDINIDPHNKDTVDAMQGYLIIETSEMEAYRRTDVQAFKSFITRVTDRIRPAYAKNSQNFPRQCIFIGTTNPEVDGRYFRDTTGNRRWWPVTTGKIRLEALRHDRDQLWAEAVHRYHAGEAYYLDTPALVAMAEKEQRDRTSVDPWVELVAEWTLSMDEKSMLPDIVTATTVAQEALGMSARSIGRAETSRIATVMKELGWERGTHNVPGVGKTLAFTYKDPLEDI